MSAILITALFVAVVIAGLVIALRLTAIRLKEVTKEKSELAAAYNQVSQRAAALQAAQKQNTKITEEANAKKRELDSTADVDLVDRANGLFNNGMHHDGESNAGGN